MGTKAKAKAIPIEKKKMNALNATVKFQKLL
jgi:hypothetical protein